MIQMRVSAQEADNLLSDINYAIFQQGRVDLPPPNWANLN